MREIIKGNEYKIREDLLIKIEATPRDANEEEKPNKQYCIVLFKELYGDHYKVYHKVLTIPELKELMGFKKKEVISWS